MKIEWETIKLVIFDLDGTLNDTDDQYIERVSQSLSFVNRVFTGWDRKHFARELIMGLETPGNAILGIPDQIGLDGLWDSWKKKLGFRQNIKTRHFRLIRGVEEMLSVASRKRKLGLASVRGEEVLKAFVDQTMLRENFSIIVHALSTPRTKPEPDPILFAAREIGVLPEECVMVGDTVVDILAGRAAGARTVGVLCGFGMEDELIRAGADLILPSTADLIYYLKN
ncbi:MAG TPA: HAD family hydrolase [Anaerolineales bacterium]|nr:HAD family hydrolase [Anaerolineales bacterium]